MSLFNHVGGLVPRKSLHDLSYSKTFTCDMGKLIPVMCDEVVPGDVFDIGNEAVIRFQPMVAPILHSINIYVHYFFVPYRLLWSDWEKFITGGEDGQFTASIPSWTSTEQDATEGSLWDYLGFPLVEGLKVNAFPKRAIKFVWNEYYRDENLQDELDITADSDNTQILNRNWSKDYFTSSLPWQQRGIAPSLPISGFAPVVSGSVTNYWSPNGNGLKGVYSQYGNDYGSTLTGYAPSGSSLPGLEGTVSIPSSTGLNPTALYENSSINDSLENYSSSLIQQSSIGNLDSVNSFVARKDSANSTPPDYYGSSDVVSNTGTVSYVDGSKLTSVNIADLRLAFQIQKWLERNARGGARYTEELRAHFGVAPRDERLQRPEYIGGSKSPVIVSEVLQTSGTEDSEGTQKTPQGNLAGHAISADFNHIGRYRATEYGLILGLMSVMPKLSYNSQGINRQWLRQTKYDYYWPEFANLSEQAIYESEIYATPTNNGHIFTGELTSDDFFGYQGRYDEMRTKHDMCCAGMRNTFSYWTMARDFDSVPRLNSDFVTCNPTKRIFAVENVDGLIVNFGNRIRALRPIPIQSEPGLIDHN